MKKRPIIITLFLVLLALFAASAFGSTVSLDTTFNGTGYGAYPVVPSPQWSMGKKFVIQPDGKIVLGGDTVDDHAPDKYGVMRFNTDGTLDTSFGTNGSTTTRVNDINSFGDLVLQPDGKILMCGQSYLEGTSFNFTIIRYTSAGVLDTTFNSTGYKTVNVNGASTESCSTMVVLPDGKILMIGDSAVDFQAQKDITLIRLNADGSLDTTFNGSGILILSVPGTNEGAHTARLLSDGKILIGGYRAPIGANGDSMLMRLNPDGSLDTSFGTGGVTVNSVNSGHDGIDTFDFQSDGKIIAGGVTYIARYTANGIFDTSFGTNGVTKVPTPYETGALVVADDDKILVTSRGIYRFTPNGVLDTNFNNGGFRSASVTNGHCNTFSVAILNDNKILAGGRCYPNGNTYFAVHRFQETRTKRFLDFNGDGTSDMSLFRPSNGQWLYMNSSTLSGQIVAGTLGTAADRPAPADFTGEGRTDVAIFRPSTGDWHVLRSENNTLYTFHFGMSGDIPVQSDYDGDDKADFAVFRPSTNEWFIEKSTGGTIIATFGAAGDKPVPSDYDGDFKTDIAIYRPSAGEWWVNKSSDANTYAFQFGTSTDQVVPGDYTGDNKTDAAFWRPSTGEWFILRSEDSSYYSIPFGLSDDLPTPGNYGWDSKFDLVVFRPSTNTWHVQLTGGPYFYRIFGSNGDFPVPNVFVP